MNFDLSQDQKMLSETAASFVRKESPVTRMRSLRDDPLGYEKGMWKRMADLGWLGILLPESVGGYGGSFVDAALILEQLGATLVPEPYLSSIVLGGMAVLRAGNDAQWTRWLAPLAQGDSTLALAYAERGSRFDVSHSATQAINDGAGYRLTGEKIFVLDGHAADAFVVSARAPSGITLFVVDRDASGVTVRPIKTMDGRKAATVTLATVEVGKDRVLGAEGSGLPVLEQVMDLGAAAACAEGAGIMRAVLEMTREYLCTREQFGVKIGSFQALQHRAVDMFIETELAKSTSILASLMVDDKDRSARQAAISAAKVQLALSGRLVTQQGIQLHGGIGITDEHDVGLYFKRMHVLNALFGDEEFHVTRFASLPEFAA